jgi:hypothetical protein
MPILPGAAITILRTRPIATTTSAAPIPRKLTKLSLGYNEITDIGPLVENEGLGSGDVVNLFVNPLDCEDQTIADNIAILEARSVDFRHDCD